MLRVCTSCPCRQFMMSYSVATDIQLSYVEGVCCTHSLRTLQALATSELELIMLLFMIMIVMGGGVVVTSVMVMAMMAMWDTEAGTCDY